MPRTAQRPLDAATDLLFDQDDDQFLGLRVAQVPLGDADAAGFVGEVENEDSHERTIVLARMDVTTVAGQAGTADVGVTSTSEASADDLIDGYDATSTGSPDNIDDGGSNGEPSLSWGPGEFVTVSEASGSLDDIEGTLFVFYVDA